jgi:hypothetical protein
MVRHTVVYHGYNEHLFPGRAHLRAFLGDNWTALEPPGGGPTSPADLTSFIRGCEAPAVFAAYALPAFGDNADLKIRSIVPIGHPIARAFLYYRWRSGKQGEAESFAEFVRAELARTRNSLFVANGQSALLAGGKWHHDLSDLNEIGPIVREICEHAEIGLAHFPQLMNCVLVKALLSIGAPISAPVALRPIADNDLLAVLGEALEQLPMPLRDDLTVRNSADLLLFDEIAKAWAAVVPAASAERERILEAADAAAELTRHRRHRTVAPAPTSITKRRHNSRITYSSATSRCSVGGRSRMQRSRRKCLAAASSWRWTTRATARCRASPRSARRRSRSMAVPSLSAGHCLSRRRSAHDCSPRCRTGASRTTA